MTVVLSLCTFILVKLLWAVFFVDFSNCSVFQVSKNKVESCWALHVWFTCRWKPTSWNCWKKRQNLIDIRDGVMPRRSWILTRVIRPSTAVRGEKTGLKTMFAPLRRWICSIYHSFFLCSDACCVYFILITGNLCTL